MIYYIDFDGTIVDCWERYYTVFCKLNKLSDIDIEEYKRIKRENNRDSIIADKLGVTLDGKYFLYKAQYLEAREYLSMDTLLIDREKLISFFDNYEAYILTKRKNAQNFLFELEIMGLERLKEHSIVLSSAEESKLDWLKVNCKTQNIVLVGDGSEEVKTICDTDILTVLVDTGFVDIRKYKCDKKTMLVESLDKYISFID